MKSLPLFLALLLSAPVLAQPDRDSVHAKKTLEIFRTIVEIDSSKSSGNVPRVARYLADQLLAAGFPKQDVEVVPKGELAALVARYRGDSSSGARPILFLAHMDVVEAHEKDWQRPPFELTQDETYFYARGTTDNKFGVAQLTSTFIRLKREGFVPTRDLYLAFSGDEESGMTTTHMLAFDRPDLARAEFALNSDAGGGDLDKQGRAVTYNVQAAEKTYATFRLTVRNPGGHSSRPRTDNAIYELADALKKIQAYRFPVRSSEMTRAYFRETGRKLGGELGEAMERFARDPGDPTAADRLAGEPSYVGTTRTTCVATMLEAGHAENALPQSATATINCRIFPGESVEEVGRVLRQVVGDEKVELELQGHPTASPISEPREDVLAAVGKAVHARYPDVKVIPYMESGGTDGAQFRRAGVPTWAVSGIFMDPDEMYAHGLDERVPIQAFYDALDHWSIIIEELAGAGH